MEKYICNCHGSWLEHTFEEQSYILKEMGHHIWWLKNNVGLHGGHWLELGMLEHFYYR
jgi:hypothetical protein